MEEDEKHLTRRCPRLGGPVSLHYCKSCGPEKEACWKIMDCWWEVFDIVGYLQDTLSEGQFQRLMRKKPKPKMTSILEIAERVQRK
jgi:hypothetical protein